MRIPDTLKVPEADTALSNTLRAIQYGRDARKAGLDRDPSADESYQDWIRVYEDRESYVQICTRMDLYWLKGWDQYRTHNY